MTGADNSPGMLEVLRDKIAGEGLENMKAIQLDLEQDSLPSTQYHLITVGMAMHHIADTEKVLRAFHTLLVPGGTLCLADLLPCGPPALRTSTPNPARSIPPIWLISCIIVDSTVERSDNSLQRLASCRRKT